MANHKVNCTLQVNPNSLTAIVAPNQREVKDNNPTVIWEAGGGTTFPATDFFAWKPGSGPGFNPTRSTDGLTLTLTYSQTAASTWTYTVTLVNGNSKVIIDPEIDNDPPGGV